MESLKIEQEVVKLKKKEEKNSLKPVIAGFILLISAILLLVFSVLLISSPKTLIGDEKLVLTGTITSEETGELISGAVISTDFGYDITDENGEYKIKNVRSGKIKLKVAKFGYKDALLT
ncbi:MAG: carboxypeptidase-like regulatory domain-containing protein, partial [Candidatus Thermoplasmatota archaeon]